MFDYSSEEFKGNWIPEGFQVRKVRRPRKQTPKWARSQSGIAMRVLGKKGRLRLRVAYLYWMAGMNYREIAETSGKSKKCISNIINYLTTLRLKD